MANDARTPPAGRAVTALLVLAIVLAGPAAAGSLAAPSEPANLSPHAAATARPGDRLPDLRMARMRDFRVARTSAGRRLLRFTTSIVNVGAGPFVLQGRRPNTRATAMTVAQRVQTPTGFRSIPTSAVMRFSGDGHSHWHTQRVADYELWAWGRPSVVRRSAKVGFCFFDTNAHKLKLPGAPRRPVWGGARCGSRASLSSTMGLSVGWADTYPWNLPRQWIDVTGLAPGVYVVRATADLENRFLERNEANNCGWTRISLNRTNKVSVLGHGTTGCPRPTPEPTPEPTPTPTSTPTPTPTPEPDPG